MGQAAHRQRRCAVQVPLHCGEFHRPLPKFPVSLPEPSTTPKASVSLPLLVIVPMETGTKNAV